MDLPPAERHLKRWEAVGMTGQSMTVAVAAATPSSCDATAAAAETIALVLGEDSPLPDSRRAVVDLVQRLRGHLMELGALAASGPAVDQAHAISSADLPDGYVPSRVYLRRLALAMNDVLAELPAVSGPS
ncbi:DUF6415 family natural product biosynthesis protein (plasmid) [Streptomyces sp. NBC_01281]|uniref:DUF6415 family natural product biosynthesis protein n=1 Tax=Streptomyces sp. NBC_01281 TaxID=2903811 RepID=UPI002E14C7FB|nr:DUF6415 family natural product biosynthesis protein [Streptomyces sp. NBC_01281]